MWNQGYPINWQAPLNRGLLSWYLRTPTLVSNARFLDVCGKSHGALSGTPLWSGGTRPGAWGALGFDGTDDYVTPDLPTRFEFGAGDWTASAWVKPTNVSIDRVIFAKAASAAWATASKTWYLKVTTGVQVLDVYGITPRTSTTGLTMGAWSHVTVTFTNSADTATFYLNGRVDGSSNFDTTVPADNAAHVLRFGVLTSVLEIPMLGPMDDIRMYNRVLTAEEIMRLYQASRTGYQQELNWIEDEDLTVGYRRFVPPSRQYYQAVNRAARY